MNPQPIIVSTWSFGARGNEAAWPALAAGGSALDAVETASCAVEADPEVDSVGFGGLPDAGGSVTLDGGIMLSPSRVGAVCAIREHLHAVSIARKVMECTPHILLAPPGADDFASDQGFEPAGLLADSAREKWERWKVRPRIVNQSRDKGYAMPECRTVPEDAAESEPDNPSPPDVPRRPLDTGEGGHLYDADDERRWEGHDTISTIALDGQGTLAAATSTSGYAFKLPGRVGDVPVIGAGLYVDPGMGAAVATGAGEIIMGVCASFLAVELMRAGSEPLEAIERVLKRMTDSFDLRPDHQAALIAMTPDGRFSSGALRAGFKISVRTAEGGKVIEPDLVLLPG